MKNSTKIYLFFVILAILDMTLSCCPETVDHGIFEYTHCGIKTFNVDNSGNDPKLIGSAEVPKEAYGISLFIERSIDQCTYTSYQSFLFPSAYAVSNCHSEDISTYVPIEYITGIKIITLRDFDNDHLAYSEVTDKFYIFKDNKFISIADYICEKDFTIQGRENLQESLLLLLMDPPEINTEHQFSVEVTLSDGRVLTDTTLVVNLI